MLDSEATSPAVKSDAPGSGGLTSDQAAARLFASAARNQAKATEQAAATTAPESSTPSTEPAAAEAQPASADTATHDTAQAETETAPAEAATTESETEATADDVLSPAPLNEELKAKIQKRIDKEVAKSRALERRLLDMEAKLNERTAPPATTATPPPAQGVMPIATPNHPLAQITDLGTLKQRKQVAKDAMRWAEDTLENKRAWKTKTDVDPQSGEEIATRVTMIGKDTYDEDQIRAIRRDAKIELEDHIPQREEFLTQRDRAVKAAHEAFPFLKDKTAPEYQAAQSMLRDPWVQMRPDAEWIVGAQIMGVKAMENQKRTAAKTGEPIKPKVTTPRPSNDQAAISASGSPSRISPESATRLARSSEREKLAAKGGITAADAAAFLLRNSTTRKPG